MSEEKPAAAPPEELSKSASKKTAGSGRTLIALAVVSLIYLALMVWAMGGVMTCPGSVEQLGWLAAQRMRYLSCLPPNALGDFLAGAFAPLAFLWLAGTVFIQSRELSAQRQELELTRNEMVLQREVMDAQATEARASTDVLRADLAYRQQADKKRQAADASERRRGEAIKEYDRIVEIILANAASINNASLMKFKGDKVYSFVFPSSSIGALGDFLANLVQNWRDFGEPEQTRIRLGNANGLSSFHRMVSALIEMKKHVDANSEYLEHDLPPDLVDKFVHLAEKAANTT